MVVAFTLTRSVIGKEDGGDIVPHLLNVGCQFRALGDDGRVYIAESVPLGIGQRHDVGQELETVGPFVAWVGVGEMFPDVSFRNGPENGVGDGVQQNVGVGVTEKALVVRDVHPSQDQPASFHQAVHVITMSYTHVVFLCVDNVKGTRFFRKVKASEGCAEAY